MLDYDREAADPAPDPATTLGATPALLEQRLLLSDDLVLEGQSATHAIVVNKITSARLKLSLPLYRFLLRFESPQRATDVAHGGSPSLLAKTVGTLVSKGCLISVDAPEPPTSTQRMTTPVAYRFCNAPALQSAGRRVSFAVLGVPYDLGGERPCRTAPTVLRQHSLDYTYQLRIDSGTPLGWFNADAERPMLVGATIADAGDLYVRYGEAQSTFAERLHRVRKRLTSVARVPVLLGGDGTLAYFALHQRGEDIASRAAAVVRITAATQSLQDVPGQVHEDNVIARLLQLENVSAVHLLGQASMTTPSALPSNLTITPASLLRSLDNDRLRTILGEVDALHLSIDLAAVTPEAVRDGLTLAELKGLIASIATHYPGAIRCIDVHGFDPTHPYSRISAVAACQLTLSAMDAATGSLSEPQA